MSDDEREAQITVTWRGDAAAGRAVIENELDRLMNLLLRTPRVEDPDISATLNARS